MPQSPQGQKQDEKVVSRRDVVKGGAATVAGALATLIALLINKELAGRLS